MLCDLWVHRFCCEKLGSAPLFVHSAIQSTICLLSMINDSRSRHSGGGGGSGRACLTKTDASYHFRITNRTWIGHEMQATPLLILIFVCNWLPKNKFFEQIITLSPATSTVVRSHSDESVDPEYVATFRGAAADNLVDFSASSFDYRWTHNNTVP